MTLLQEVLADVTKAMQGESQGLQGWSIDQLDFPTFRITLIAKIMDRLTLRSLAARGDMTYAEWRVLARLAALPAGGTVGQVADLAWVDRAEVSRAVIALQRKGIARRRKNPQDQRTPIIFVTRKGMEQYAATLKERMAFHESLLLDLSAEDRSQLDGLLAKIGDRLLQLMQEDGGD